MKTIYTIQNFAKRFASLVLVLLTVGVGSMWGAKYSMTPDQASTGSSATTYIETLTGFTYANPTGSKIKWKMNYWNPKTLQIKSNQSNASNEFRFYTDSVLPGKITKVVVTFSALTVSDATKLMFKGGISAQTSTSSGTAGTWNGSAKTLTWTPGSSDNYTYFAFYQNGKAASGSNYLASSDAIVVTYLTKVTLDKNGGTADGVAYFDDNASAASTATGYTFSAPTHATKTCTGYYTTSSGGTKVLNADGTFAATTVSGYITSSKWTYAGGTLRLYAQWEASLSDRDVLVYDDREQYDTIGYYGTLTSFSLSYMTDGGGDVTWSSTDKDVVTVEDDGEGGATVTVVGAGSADIEATVAEDAEYNEAVGTYEVVILAVAPTLSHNTSGKELTVGSITSTGATFSGAVVTSKGGEASLSSYGFIVGTSADVKYKDRVTQAGTNDDYPINTAFGSKSVTGLTPNTTYYVRAIANTSGGGIGYSTAVSFTTLQRYAVSYNNNGGSGSKADEYKDHGISFTLPSNAGDMTKTGYHIADWKLGSSSGTSYSLGGSYTTDAAATFYVGWAANTYQVKFDANGGSGSMSNEDFTYGTSKALTTCSFTPPTHKYFIGWNTDKDATTALYTDGQSVNNLTSTHEGTFTLYAIWKDHTFTNYRTKCCTDLSAIGGTVVYSDPSTAVLTWNAMSNVDATTPYVVTYRTGSDEFGSSNVGSITTNGAGKKTCTITGLSCNTDYDFKIEITAATGYCDIDSVMSGKNSGKWNVAYSLSGVTKSEGPDAGRNVCGDYSAEFAAASAAFDLPTSITVQIGGVTVTKGTEYTWDDAEGTLTIDDAYITGDISISITGVAKSCTTDASLGTPMLSSITNGTITVRCPSISAGTNCAITDYGFIWKASSAPADLDDNKNQVGTDDRSTAFDKEITIASFATGTTYNFKAYGTNGNGTAYSSNLAVTPRSITFNSNGGSSVTTKYVNSGTATSAPSAPTKTGYIFDDWYTTSGLSTAMNFSGTIAKDTTLYAKWIPDTFTVTISKNYGAAATKDYEAVYGEGMPDMSDFNNFTRSGYTLAGIFANNDGTGTKYYDADKNSAHVWDQGEDKTIYAAWTPNDYTITLNNHGADSGKEGDEEISVTYDSNTNLSATPAITKPQKTNYLFCGYYTGENGTGSQIIDENGDVVASVSNYTNATKQWIKASNVTLHAYWKRVYTVTWKANGETWSSGVVTGNTTVISGEKVSALPTSPTSADCDDLKKFMGWRATAIDGTSASDPGSIFTTKDGSPAITQDTVFYAVFASEGGGDYTRVTSTSQLADGKKIIMGYEETANSGEIIPVQSTYFGSSVLLMGTTAGSTGTGTINMSTLTYTGGTNYRFILHEGYNDDYWAFEMSGEQSGQYIGHNGRNAVKQNEGLQSDDKTDFTIEIGENDVATITNKYGDENSTLYDKKYHNYKLLRYNYNNGAPRAAIYESGQNDLVLYICNPLTYSNYVTTCASCTAAPTFNETYAAVSEIGCTGATVTATDGLATLGTGDGCHIREYGFVWGTNSTPTLETHTGGDVYTVSKNIDEDTEWNYEITGLTKGTQYYVRAYATNKSGTAYTTAQSFYTQGVSSIAITTAPTAVKYIAGQKFNPAGMVVTATMADGSTVDVTEDCTFSPATALTAENTSVTVTYELCDVEKTANQAINVYSISVSEGDNASYGEYSTNTPKDTITVTPSSGKTYSLAVTNATAVDNLDGSHTITSITGNVTVVINYRNATTVSVNYYVNGTKVITQSGITESTTATLKNASEVATAIAATAGASIPHSDYPNFVGWSRTEIATQSTEPELVTGTPTINANTNLYAVYSNIDKIRFDETVYSGAYQSSETEATAGGKTFVHKQIMLNATTRLQFHKGSSDYGYLYNKTAISNIVRVEIGVPGSTYNGAIPVYACSDKNTISGSALKDEDTADDRYIYLFPENTQYFIAKGDNSNTYNVDYIDIYYCSTALKYMTNSYTVTCDMNGYGDEVVYEKVLRGEKIAAPETPVRPGYSIESWNTKANGSGSEWNYASSTVTSTTTLYAQWSDFEGKTFEPSAAAGNWSTAADWGGELPTKDDIVRIKKPMTVDVQTAAAKEIVLEQDGSGKTFTLTIGANQALKVDGPIRVEVGDELRAPTETELILGSSSSGNATLIFDNSNEAAATVQMYSKATTSGPNWTWQYVAAPAAVSALYNYYGGYLYKWNDGWDAVTGSHTMEPFAGYCSTFPSAGHTYEIQGQLVETTSQNITVPAGKNWVCGNSWTAPIQITQMTSEDFVNVEQTIYLFNTGMDNAEVTSAASESTSNRYAPSTYVTIPINAAGTTPDGHESALPSKISSLQGFYVKSSQSVGGTVGTLKLSYSKHVRPTGGNTPDNGAMHAPKREQEQPQSMSVIAHGKRYSSSVLLLAREDFTQGYDAGWDGENINSVGAGPLIYSLREDGTKDAVSAVPDFEGTLVSFHAGEDSEYTFKFAYSGEEVWYLNDLQEQNSIRISSENSYSFTASANDAARFVISATPVNGAMSIGNVADEQQSARKLMIDGMLYIIRAGRIYSAEGALVK